MAVGTGFLGYLGEHFIAGVFPQQWWSVGGAGSNTTSNLNVQYFASYFLPDGWSVGTSPSLLVNWSAPPGGNMLTFPVGASIAKVQRLGILPVRFAVQGMYMPLRPNVFGQTWLIQLVAPVIPKLIKGDLF